MTVSTPQHPVLICKRSFIKSGRDVVVNVICNGSNCEYANFTVTVKVSLRKRRSATRFTQL